MTDIGRLIADRVLRYSKDLAAKDIAGATDADAQQALGDGWWALAQKDQDPARVQIQRHAAKWYAQALPTLTGLEKAKAQERLKSLAAIVPTAPGEQAKGVNLLKMIDLTRDSVSGKWSFQNGALVCVSGASARVQFLYQPPAEYDYRMVFARVSGNGSVNPLCWAAQHQFEADIGAWGNAFAGFGLIGGKWSKDTPTARQSEAWLKNGQRYTLVIKVRRDGVQAYLDDKLITEWKTDYSDMSLWDGWQLPRNNTIGLGADRSSIIFYSVDVIEITGHGQALKPDNP